MTQNPKSKREFFLKTKLKTRV